MHKKGDKHIVNNYRAVSLLTISNKILEKIIFNSILKFLSENKLLNDAQSGVRPSDSGEYQLLSIVHDIYKYHLTSILLWKLGGLFRHF